MRLGLTMLIVGSLVGASGVGLRCFVQELIAQRLHFYPFTLMPQDLFVCESLGLCLAILGGGLAIGGIVRMIVKR